MVLERVSVPIRRYLRSRDDTIRCILMAFTDEQSELYEEFMNADAATSGGVVGDDGGDADNDDVATGDVAPADDIVSGARADWSPEPMHAAPNARSNGRQGDAVRQSRSTRGMCRRRLHAVVVCRSRCWSAFSARPIDLSPNFVICLQRGWCFLFSFRILCFFVSQKFSKNIICVPLRLLKVTGDFDVNAELTLLEMFKLRFGDELLVCLVCFQKNSFSCFRTSV